MRDWFQEKHRQLAFWIWAAGLFSLYVASTQYAFVGMTRSLHGISLLATMITAIPLGWGVLKRSAWAKWGLLALMMLVAVALGFRAMAAPTVIRCFGLFFAIWCMVRLIRWDITSEQEAGEGQEWFDRLIEQMTPPPIAPSSIDLECAAGKSLSKEILAAAVTQAFGRQCKISDSTNNLDLGVESAFTTADTAVVGGVESDRVVHLIVGANPVSLEVLWVGFTGETSGGLLTISTPRQSLGNDAKIDGYDWTIPLAAALWSETIICAKPENESESLNSVAALLEWNANRRN